MKRRVHSAEGVLACARRELISGNPEAVGAAAAHIGDAIALLQRARPAEPAQLRRIRTQIIRLAALLESARRFYDGLARLHSPDDDGPGNYTRLGQTCAASAKPASLNTHG